eukprot:1145398-Pelagomonas_calceolata.AAC.1
MLAARRYQKRGTKHARSQEISEEGNMKDKRQWERTGYLGGLKGSGSKQGPEFLRGLSLACRLGGAPHEERQKRVSQAAGCFFRAAASLDPGEGRGPGGCMCICMRVRACVCMPSPSAVHFCC